MVIMPGESNRSFSRVLEVENAEYRFKGVGRK